VVATERRGSDRFFNNIMEMRHEIGKEVVLFNSMSLQFEKDVVYGVLYIPVPKEGAEQSAGAEFADRFARGEMVVKEQCQTLQHQIVDADLLFDSEEECRVFYKEVLSGEGAE